jgi:hypothetical protein
MHPLPDSTTLESVLTIGQVTMSVQSFIRYGYVVQQDSRFFQVSTRPTLINDSVPSKPSLFSLRELERAGWKVIPGKTADQDLVMFAPGSYCSISNAIRNGLLTNITK